MSLALEWKDPQYPARGEERRGGEVQEVRWRKSVEESRRLRLIFMCFLCVAAFLSGLFILNICLQVIVVQGEIKAREVEKQIELERRLHEGIRLEIASLESPARIEQMAKEHLGMVPVARAEYLETQAYQAAKAEQQDRLSGGEGMVSEATMGSP
jgi:cell division protein FtsL